MSDEAERVRATLRVLDVLEFNGVPAAVVTADAVKALETLESQNQALQKEVDRLKAREMPTLQRKGVATASGTTSDNAALQERAEKAEAEVVRLRRIFEVLAHEDWRGNKPLHITIAEGALSHPGD